MQPLRLPIWPLALFTLWDFYFADVRIFDQLGAAALLTLIWANPNRQVNPERATKIACLTALIWFITFESAFRNPDVLKTAAGLLEGGLAAIIIASVEWRREDIHRLLRWLIIVHASACIFQFAVFHIFHYSLNYQAWLGTSLRTGANLGIRPAGLFLEPAGFAVTMFSMLTLYRIVGARDWRIEMLGLFAILLSLSLWGWGSALVYMILFRPIWALVLAPFIAAALAYIAVTMVNAKLNDSIVMWAIVKRILHPGQDNSSHARYAGLLGITSIWDWRIWFGEGIKTSYNTFGSNGLSFLLSSSGLAGGIAMTALWWLVLPAGRKIQGVLSLMFMLSAASLWTFCWWWTWLALAGSTGVARFRRTAAESQQVATV
jgi:hypothetical protein